MGLGDLQEISRLDSALAKCQDLQDLAREYGINDIFQDNGGKVLQALIVLGLRNAPGGREGNDAVDAEGKEYELKTVNMSLAKKPGITTHHHLNEVILEKYRNRVEAWYISFYENIKLREIYFVSTKAMEPMFQAWELRIAKRIEEGKSPDLNNPKIPQWFVKANGVRVWPTVSERQAELLPESSPLNLSEASLQGQ